MKNRPIFITNIVKSLLIFIFLLFIFTKNEQILSKIAIIVFLFLTFCYIGENLCNLINKPKGAKIFHKSFIIIFLLFGFSFLILWSYAWIKENKYFPLIFTIPFWVLGIYLTRRFLFGIKPKPAKQKKKVKIDFRIVVAGFLVLSVLISGIVCLTIDIHDTYQSNKITKDYLKADAYFKDYEIYNISEELKNNKTETHTTYRLIYTYEIEGTEYTIKTDYGVSSIPSINSIREIKYNPNDPSEAVLTGTNGNNGLIYFGAFFILGGMVT